MVLDVEEKVKNKNQTELWQTISHRKKEFVRP